MIMMRWRLRDLQTLDEFLVISSGRALPISNGFNSMPHFKKILDISWGHLGRIADLLSFGVPLIVRLRILLSGSAHYLIWRLAWSAVILRWIWCLLLIIWIRSISAKESVPAFRRAWQLLLSCLLCVSSVATCLARIYMVLYQLDYYSWRIVRILRNQGYSGHYLHRWLSGCSDAVPCCTEPGDLH